LRFASEISSLAGKSVKALNPTQENPCISPVSLLPSDTYIDRPTVSEQIALKVQKPCGSKLLAHTLAITGLGGIGKTQLVLNYVQEHGKKYDTIFLARRAGQQNYNF
jgi:hypothetical protein